MGLSTGIFRKRNFPSPASQNLSTSCLVINAVMICPSILNTQWFNIISTERWISFTVVRTAVNVRRGQSFQLNNAFSSFFALQIVIDIIRLHQPDTSYQLGSNRACTRSSSSPRFTIATLLWPRSATRQQINPCFSSTLGSQQIHVTTR